MNNDLISRSELTKELRERLIACNDWEEQAKNDESRARANAVKTFICEMFMLLKEIPTVTPEKALTDKLKGGNDNAPSAEPEPVSERQKRALAIVEALTEKRLRNVMERGCLRRSILLEPERPQVESIPIEDGLKKARHGKYVIYDVDFLLDNLAREVNIMESTRQWKAGKGNDND